MLADLLRKNEAALADRWLELILASYNPDTAGFFKQQKNRFANPVGQTFAEQTRVVTERLLAGEGIEAFQDPLHEIVRIRAIQEFTAAEAVGFVFLLKDAVRETLADSLRDEQAARELQAGLHELERRIDRIALLTFDIFVSCRERVYSLRLREIRAGYVQPG
ncbi:MAG: hypothetical protein GY838_09790 [bacterium]|nr:hypothetical protein [bacterium]